MVVNKGSALIDYIVPTAIVGLVVGLGLYNMYASGTLLKFISGSADMKMDLNKGHAIIGGLKDSELCIIQASDLGGTPNNPVVKCFGNQCVIDYGDFILNGIPQNLSEIVETAGTSGGTSVLMSVLDQIVDQLIEQGDKKTAEDFKNLANLGHLVSTLQETVELAANTCNGDVECFKQKLKESPGVPIPSEVSHLLPNYRDYTLESMLNYNRLEQASYFYYNLSSTYSNYKSMDPAFKMIDIYQNIQNNPAISDAMKQVAQGVLSQMSDISFNLSILSQSTTHPSGLCKYNFSNGSQVGCTPPESVATLYDIVHPQTSLNDHLYSAIICKTGSYDDVDRVCK
jgi:hypothetical protein